MTDSNSVLSSSFLRGTLLVAGIASIGAMQARADNSFGDFFDNGKLLLDARYRFESVSQDGKPDDAAANTIRVRAGFQTGKVWDLQGLIEAEGIFHLNDAFDDTLNGHTTYPIVADPEDIQINRLQIEYSGLPQTLVTVGRQRMNLDNQRFVGGVAFRQNEQTFDAVRFTNTSIENLSLTYAYINQVNRVFGEDSPQGHYDSSSHLFNAAYDIKGWGKLTGYAYLLDLRQAPTQSTATLGARLAGKHELATDISVLYALEYANQKDYGNNTADVNLNYWLLEGGVASHGFKLLAGQETLEGNGSRGFATPLATLHKFQGYADVFLNTPANGIVDTYGTLAYETKLEDAGPVTGVMAAITYHEFEADRGSASFGNETDYEVVARLGDNWSAGVKYADYKGDAAFADRDKLWLTVEFNY
ncbi:MAG: hypothetical protein ABL973_09975 [Micropepsaceae bacterium]